MMCLFSLLHYNIKKCQQLDFKNLLPMNLSKQTIENTIEMVEILQNLDPAQSPVRMSWL